MLMVLVSLVQQPEANHHDETQDSYIRWQVSGEQKLGPGGSSGSRTRVKASRLIVREV